MGSLNHFVNQWCWDALFREVSGGLPFCVQQTARFFSWASSDHGNVGCCAQWQMLELSFVCISSINLSLAAHVPVANWLFTVHLCQRPLRSSSQPKPLEVTTGTDMVKKFILSGSKWLWMLVLLEWIIFLPDGKTVMVLHGTLEWSVLILPISHLCSNNNLSSVI